MLISSLGGVVQAAGDARCRGDASKTVICLIWGLRPAAVTAESWLSGVENSKYLKDQGLGFLITLEMNRVVSEQAHTYQPICELDLPEKGKVVHLGKVGFVTVFRTVDKHGFG